MGSYCTYSIPGKTAALVPEFEVEDLPSAELQPWVLLCREGHALGQNTLMIYIIISVLPNGRSFTANSGTKAANLL